VQLGGAIVIGADEGQIGCAVEGFGASARVGRAIGVQVERRGEPAFALPGVAVDLPEFPQAARQTQRGVGRSRRQAPGQRRAHVVVVALQLRQAGQLVSTAQVGVGAFHEVETPAGVPRAHGGFLVGFAQALDGVLANGVEQPVAGHAVLLAHAHQRLIDELAQAIQNVVGVQDAARTDGFHGFDTGAGENAEAPQQGSLWR
jgi:hypothetical protein